MAKEDDLFEEDAPKDLPEAQTLPIPEESQSIVPDVTRICPKCGKEASRIVSNLLGRQAYCGPCKFDWPIGPPVVTAMPPILGRGLSKQTVVQPDWNLAVDEIDPQGPK
jgi:hypothetical protein